MCELGPIQNYHRDPLLVEMQRAWVPNVIYNTGPYDNCEKLRDNCGKGVERFIRAKVLACLLLISSRHDRVASIIKY